MTSAAACDAWAGGAPPASDVQTDETVLLFPVFAAPSAEGHDWIVEIHGWIYEPFGGVDGDSNPGVRETLFRRAVGVGDASTGGEGSAAAAGESRVFRPRAALFLADSERGKRIVVEIGGELFALRSPSGPDGHFRDRIRLSRSRVAALGVLSSGRPAVARVVLSPGDQRAFQGDVHFLGAEGLSIVSDIDDTVKISHVRDKGELLANTFLREFRPVPGMAELYARACRAPGTTVHYVSAGPWQLYPPLEAFRRDTGLPAGTWHLRAFRWKDERVLNLFAAPHAHKTAAIESLLTAAPHRKLVLVGDSGEHDPEIYGDLARRHKGRIVRILIRNVTGEPAESPRYRAAFREVPGERWQVFEMADEVAWSP